MSVAEHNASYLGQNCHDAAQRDEAHHVPAADDENEWPRRQPRKRYPFDYAKIALGSVDAVPGGGTEARGEFHVTGSRNYV